MDALKIKKLHENAILPARATEGSAGLDLYACIDAPVNIYPGDLLMVPTGVAVALPQGTAGFLYARSGLAVKHRVTLSNGVGVIDCDYRGEIKVGLCNLGRQAYVLKPGERFAQLVVMPVLCLPLLETNTLDDTPRGEGGFGSTGAE